jgi:glutathione S-transferase
MAKIHIWGRTTSSNVKKVLWLLDELDLPYDRTDAGMAFGVVETPSYKALNPNSRIPTLQEGDFTLWESNSILRYLAMAHGGAAFYPDEPRARASIDRWLDWQLSTLVPAEFPIFWGTIRTPAEKRDLAALPGQVGKVAPLWAILDRRLGAQRFVEGDRFTLADIPLGVFVHRWFANGFIERPVMPALAAWYERLKERPAYRAHVDLPLE